MCFQLVDADDFQRHTVYFRIDGVDVSFCNYLGILQCKNVVSGVVAHSSTYAFDYGEVVAVGRGYLLACNSKVVSYLCLRCCGHCKHCDEQCNCGCIHVLK